MKQWHAMAGRHSPWRPAAVALGLALLAGLTACTYTGRAGDPVSRKLTWFSFLEGDDIRSRCGTSASEWEVRLVYNGNYDKQLRSYHIVGDGAGGAFVSAQATPGDYGSLTAVSLSDPFAAVRWKSSQTRIGPEARAELEAKLRDSGIYDPPPTGLRLPSWGWYWTSTACKDGEVFFNAWLYPSERWDMQDFRGILGPYDGTEVAFTKPVKAIQAKSEQTGQRDKKGSRIAFTLQVGENGLKGTQQLF
jgi:hypothetical protein